MAYFDLNPMLGKMLDVGANVSDLNLSVGKPPQVEIEGQLRAVPYSGIERLAPYHTELVAMRLLRGKRDLTERLLRSGSVDLSYSLAQRTRFRVNIFRQNGNHAIVMRKLNTQIPTIDGLKLPRICREIVREKAIRIECRSHVLTTTSPTSMVGDIMLASMKTGSVVKASVST